MTDQNDRYRINKYSGHVISWHRKFDVSRAGSGVRYQVRLLSEDHHDSQLVEFVVPCSDPGEVIELTNTIGQAINNCMVEVKPGTHEIVGVKALSDFKEVARNLVDGWDTILNSNFIMDYGITSSDITRSIESKCRGIDDTETSEEIIELAYQYATQINGFIPQVLELVVDISGRFRGYATYDVIPD